MNDTEKEFICHICKFLPNRRPGKRGTKPIEKKVIITELFKLFKTNCGWRNIKHSSTCRNYLYEVQRRGKFKNFFNFLTKELKKFRLRETIVDSSDIESYRTNGLVKYSGKYHKDCIKVSVEFTPEYVPVSYRLDKGTEPDSLILDKMLSERDKLPYQLYLDKGYEGYTRRRKLRKRNCQVKMEMKKYAKNRKRGPRFRFSEDDKKQRGDIEKVFAWIKSFMAVKLNRLKIKSLIHAMFVFCLSFITFRRLLKL